MLADYHMHSSFSDDSIFPMEDEIKRAIALGLDEICFCEHVDHGVKIEENCDYKAYTKEFNRCAMMYGDSIILKKGIEFGVQTHTIEQFEKDYESNDFDFVILSCHQVHDLEFWNQDFQKGKTQKEYNQAYYQEILDVVKSYNHYSVLGHLDMISRYDMAGEYPFEKIHDIIKEILTYIIAQGKGIEINTSCFRYGLNDLTPSRDILRLYKELGGTLLTFGSDAHSEDHVGAFLSFAKEEAKKLGFTQFCTFSKMKPTFHEL